MTSRIEKLIRVMKQGGDDQCIPIVFGARTVGRLRPLACKLSKQTLADLRLMTARRNHQRQFFFQNKTVTLKGTLAWYKKAYRAEGRDILFYVELPNGTSIGQLGLQNIDSPHGTCEIGRVLRGRKGGVPGLMSMALTAVLSMARVRWSISSAYLDVFADNDRAVELYQRVGFTIVETYQRIGVPDKSGGLNWGRSPENVDISHNTRRATCHVMKIDIKQLDKRGRS